MQTHARTHIHARMHTHTHKHIYIAFMYVSSECLLYHIKNFLCIATLTKGDAEKRNGVYKLI
jgi:hypothetical protein